MASIESNIVFGGPEICHESEKYKSFGDYSLSKFKEHFNRIILVDGVTNKKYTGKDIYNDVTRLAYCLQHLNIKDNDVVGISSENRYEFVITLFATYCLNATLAPLNVTYTERELEHAVNLSKPKVFFVSNVAAEKIARVAEKNKFITHIFNFDGTRYKNISSFQTLLKDRTIKSQSNYNIKNTDWNENNVLIVCSSGTTGLPKGVQLNQRNVMNTVDRQLESNIFEDVTILSVIPWFHAFGCLTLMLVSTSGNKLVFLPKFEETLFLTAIERTKVDIAFMVPPLMVFLAKHPLVDKYDLSSLKLLTCGAAPLSKETEDAVKARIGIPLIYQGYGLSESTLSLLVQSPVHCKSGSVGGLKPGHYAKVIDPDTQQILGPNQRGELCFKGPCIMKGYIGDIEATKNVIDAEGWFHSGDIGYYDDDLEFFIVDRIKELIKYKAFQVPPAEIEAILLMHPSIKDAAVVGLPDEISGELPFAFVVKQPNVQLNEEEVIEFVAKQTSPAKRLRGGVEFINEIPKNPSGKILRRVLRDMLKERNLSPKSKL